MSALAVLLHCPACGGRDLADVTPPAEEDGWWARMLCRACHHRWSARW
ncbi:hypothetical protein [Klenkia sp. PcliD-1-E]|nr:hypothetical protein [Klenkia sp. PcliD-1-E]MCO7221318.1 hypothetical protein [Klenkia sp. PcliD-1-E]